MSEIIKKPLVILTGPTAVGKTELSIKLAKAINGEIISADSMQVYKYMDIGSAKITPEEMDGVKHYLIDCLEPSEDFNVVKFTEMAKVALNEIVSKGKIPILTGGTGFYIQALLYDIDFTKEEDLTVRKELEEFYQNNGKEKLFEKLKECDPKSATLIPPENIKRVIRAIEFYEINHFPISQHNEEQRQKESAYNSAYFVLNDERSNLYDRIDKRVDLMMEKGLLEEVKNLYGKGIERGYTSMQGLGYKEICDYLDGICSLDEAIYTIKRDSRHFAKRQITWFKRERDVIWFNKPDFAYDHTRILKEMLIQLKNKNIIQ